MVKKLLKLLTLLIIFVAGLAFFKIQFIGKDLDEASLESFLLRSKPEGSSVKLTFLGTSCFILEHQGKQAVLDPFFSNPNIFTTAFTKIPYPSLSKYIDSNMYQNVRLITVSHGHYDHCLDIGNFLDPVRPATVVADQGILHELAPVLTENRADLRLADRSEKKDWIYAADSSYRVYTLPSTHSPHIANITMFSGTYPEPLKELPAKWWNWKLCECNSFLVDMIDSGRVTFRVLMCTGNMNPDGIADLKELCKGQRTDLMLHIFWKREQCWNNLNEMYLIAKPNLVVLHHWNNFFRSNDKSLQYLKPSELPGILQELSNTGIPVKIMTPFSTVEL